MGPFVARLPIRVLGLFLLTLSISVASCQAFVHTLTRLESSPTDPQAVSDQR
jgi:hypothetical protein